MRIFVAIILLALGFNAYASNDGIPAYFYFTKDSEIPSLCKVTDAQPCYLHLDIFGESGQESIDMDYDQLQTQRVWQVEVIPSDYARISGYFTTANGTFIIKPDTACSFLTLATANKHIGLRFVGDNQLILLCYQR